MAFHYLRKYGSEGILQRVDGLGTKGEPLRRFGLHHNLPLRACLEILSFVADIISDSMKNSFVHGDIKSDNINVLQDGSIILNGYGRPRRQTLAPEGTLSIPGDVYSLGILMLELLSGQADIELPLEETLHNQKVLEIFLSIDWKEWSAEPFLPNMQEYLISLLFFDPSSRPHPLDVANILSEALQTTHPPSLPSFIQQNNIQIQDHKEQLSAASTLRSSMIAPVEVTADSSQGIATGFWSRDKIAQMFQTDMEDDKALQEEWKPPQQLQPTPPPPTLPPQASSIEAPPPQPQYPSYPEPPNPPPPQYPSNHNPQDRQSAQQASPLFREQTTANIPSIPRAPVAHTPQGQGFYTAEPPPPKPVQPTHFAQPEVTAPPTIPPSFQREPVPPLRQDAAPPAPPPQIPQRHPPQAVQQQAFSISTGNQPNISQGNEQPFSAPATSSHPQYTPPPSSPSQPMSGGVNKTVLFAVGGLVVFLLLVITGLAAAYLLKSEESPPTQQTVEIKEPQQAEEPTIAEEPEPLEELPVQKTPVKTAKPPPKKTTTSTSRPKKSTQRNRRPTKSTSETPKTETTQPKLIANSNFQVQIKFREENANISCGDGQQKEFSGIVSMTFTSPQSCRIDLENGERGSFVARKEGSINCKLDGSNIICR